MAEVAELTNTFQIVGFLDDALPAGEMVLGYPVLEAISQFSELRTVCDQAIIAIANNFDAKHWCSKRRRVDWS